MKLKFHLEITFNLGCLKIPVGFRLGRSHNRGEETAFLLFSRHYYKHVFHLKIGGGVGVVIGAGKRQKRCLSPTIVRPLKTAPCPPEFANNKS